MLNSLFQGATFAIKILNFTEEESATDIETEIDILKQCRNANIVSYYGTCRQASRIWVIKKFLKNKIKIQNYLLIS